MLASGDLGPFLNSHSTKRRACSVSLSRLWHPRARRWRVRVWHLPGLSGAEEELGPWASVKGLHQSKKLKRAKVQVHLAQELKKKLSGEHVVPVTHRRILPKSTKKPHRKEAKAFQKPGSDNRALPDAWRLGLPKWKWGHGTDDCPCSKIHLNKEGQRSRWKLFPVCRGLWILNFQSYSC